MNLSLTSRAMSGLRWKAASIMTVVGAQFVIGVLLARQLAPADFGIMTFALIFVGFANTISQLGVAPAIVQCQQLNEHHLRVGFTLAVLSALAIYGVLFIVGGHLTSSVRLTVLRVAAVSLVLTSIGVTAEALLQRAFDFKRLFVAEVGGSVVGYGTVSLTLTALGFGVWSLVFGLLTRTLVKSMLLLVLSPHPFTPSLRGMELRELSGYGVGMSLAKLANVVGQNGHYWIVGAKLGDALLGFYQQGYRLVMLPVANLSLLSTQILFPAFASVQGQRARLRRGFFTSVSLASVCVFPLMAGLAIGAPEIVVGLLTRKWLPSLPIVQLFCVYGLFAAIYTLGDALARAVGKVYWQFGIHAAFAGSSLVLTAIGAQYGIQYVAAGMIVSVLLIYGLSGGLISHILGTRWITFLRAHVPGVCMALVVGTFAWVAADVARRLELAELVRLVVVVLACGGGLVGAFVLLPRVLLDPLPEFVYENAGARLPGLLRKVIVRKLSLSATGTVGVGK